MSENNWGGVLFYITFSGKSGQELKEPGRPKHDDAGTMEDACLLAWSHGLFNCLLVAPKDHQSRDSPTHSELSPPTTPVQSRKCSIDQTGLDIFLMRNWLKLCQGDLKLASIWKIILKSGLKLGVLFHCLTWDSFRCKGMALTNETMLHYTKNFHRLEIKWQKF